MWIQYESTSWRLQAQSRVLFESEAEESPGYHPSEEALVESSETPSGAILSEVVLEPPWNHYSLSPQRADTFQAKVTQVALGHRVLTDWMAGISNLQKLQKIPI